MRRFMIPVAILALLIGAAVFAVLISRPPVPEPQPPTPVSLRFNWIHQPLFMGYYVAQDLGYYTDEGLDVTFKEYETGLDQTDEVAAGGSDFTLSSAFEILSAADAGKDVKAVAAILQTFPEAYASLANDGIRAPSDFKGKTLGIKAGNKSTGIVYRSLMSRAGLDADDATFKDLDYSMDVAGDLRTGRADVVHLYRNDEAYGLLDEGADFNLMLPETFGARSYGDVIVTSGELIERNPEMVRKFVAASIRGWEFALTHRDDALTIARRYVDDRYKFEAYERFIYDQTVPLVRPLGGERIGVMHFSVWNGTADMMIRAGAIRPDFPVTSAYTTAFVSE